MDQQLIGNALSVDGTCAVLTLFTTMLGSMIPKANIDKDATTALGTAREEAKQMRTVYDFIVVGGGTAGSVVASRLTENPRWNVLVLEAGCEEVPLNDPPTFGIAENPACVWNYTPEANSRLNNGFREIFGRDKLVSGMVLGGSSSINALVYDRGHPADYDAWARKVGDPSWSYKNVLNYFKKSEGMTDKILAEDTVHHSTTGPLGISVPDRAADPIPNVLMETFREFGYPEVDPNAGKIGASVPQFTYRDGVRTSTYRAFLEPARKRPNLYVSTHARVTKIIVNKLRTAIGVKFVDLNGKEHTVRARKEVIVSAGVFETPRLLMISGIGPAEQLTPLGIPVVRNLPVGVGLRDHLTIGGAFLLRVPNDPPRLTVLIEKWIEFLKEDTGPFSYPFIAAQLVESFRNHSAPDWEFMFTRMHDDKSCPGLGRVDDNAFYNTVAPSVFVLRPKSVGQVRLRDANLYSSPIVDINYLEHPDDMETAKRALRSLAKLQDSHVLRLNGIKVDTSPVKGCEQYSSQDHLTDEYLECVVRSGILSFYDFSGSCPMGRRGTGVVSPDLRVHGLRGLRVVDASVIPVPLSGHTNAAVIMVAEKASVLIKRSWGRRH